MVKLDDLETEAEWVMVKDPVTATDADSVNEGVSVCDIDAVTLADLGKVREKLCVCSDDAERLWVGRDSDIDPDLVRVRDCVISFDFVRVCVGGGVMVRVMLPENDWDFEWDELRVGVGGGVFVAVEVTSFDSVYVPLSVAECVSGSVLVFVGLFTIMYQSN